MRLAIGNIQRRNRSLQRTWTRLSNLFLIFSKDRRDALMARMDVVGRPSARERQQELVRFYLRYEELVEILLDGVQVGPTPSLEATYQSSRLWMKENYPAVRRFVIAYLKYSADDARQSLAMNGLSADAFEALFMASSLNEFLLQDDGQMISRIERTRDALNLYGHHLRRLASKE